jgi:hypothetical protein
MADQTRCVLDGSFSACASVRHHIGHLLLAVAVVAGCSTGAGPVGHPVDISPETTSTPPPPVPVAALDGLLPAPDQLNDMFHTVTLHVIDNDSTMFSADVTAPECVVTWRNAWQPAYEGSGWIAVRRQYIGNGDNPQVLQDNTETKIFQSVASFPHPIDANAFYAKQISAWKACDGQKIEERGKGDEPSPDDSWFLGEASDRDGLLTMPSHSEHSNNAWACQRALTIRNNVAADVMVCRSQATNQGETLAAAIAAKVPVK